MPSSARLTEAAERTVGLPPPEPRAPSGCPSSPRTHRAALQWSHDRDRAAGRADVEHAAAAHRSRRCRRGAPAGAPKAMPRRTPTASSLATEPEPRPSSTPTSPRSSARRRASCSSSADAALLSWSRDRADRSHVTELKRLLHTLKGGARMAGIRAMGDLSHEMESFLAAVEGGTVASEQDAIAVLQASLDELHRMRDAAAAGQRIVPALELIARARRRGGRIGRRCRRRPRLPAAGDVRPQPTTAGRRARPKPQAEVPAPDAASGLDASSRPEPATEQCPRVAAEARRGRRWRRSSRSLRRSRRRAGCRPQRAPAASRWSWPWPPPTLPGREPGRPPSATNWRASRPNCSTNCSTTRARSASSARASSSR